MIEVRKRIRNTEVDTSPAKRKAMRWESEAVESRDPSEGYGDHQSEWRD